MSVLEEATYGFVSVYEAEHGEGPVRFKVGLSSNDIKAQQMLCSLKDHPVTAVAQALCEAKFHAPEGGCDVVIYGLTRALTMDACRERDTLNAHIIDADMYTGAEFISEPPWYELAVPVEEGQHDGAILLAGTLAGMPFVSEAWVVRLHVLEHTFPMLIDIAGNDRTDCEPEDEQPDDGSDAEGGGDDRDP